ncbi:hypothetical protein CQW23_32590 [Capsicum baccatum]|uniref:Protein TAR1 n=1 Tax=Capsicum baccatum TaxID=33114 RepID=A0A2G2V4F1_CAPBA|nr:hypothetical protein CQW23_32590 [Capsicum baccatum]
MCKFRSHGTFPLFGLQSSHLNICYYHQDLHRRSLRLGSRLRFCSDRHALLLIRAWHLPQRPGVGRALKRHPFSGLVDSAVSLPASTRVSSGFAPFRHSSPSFGSRQNPWSVFQDGSTGEPTGQRSECADAEACRRRALHARIEETTFHERIESPGFGRPPIHAGPRPGSIGIPARRRSTYDRGTTPAPIRFPPDNFKHSLTLFSKSFSSFPRGTCLLTVSRPYLALDVIHRPIWVVFPNNPTRRQRLVVRQGLGTTGLSPSPAPPSRGLGPGLPLRTLLQTTIRTSKPPDSKAGLFPIRSPLLRESL